MILNDNQIANKFLLSPFIGHKVSEFQGNKVLSYGCSSFSYDITLADHDFKIFDPGCNVGTVDPKKFDPNCLSDSNLFIDGLDSYFLMPAKSYALAVSRELFSIPKNVFALAVGKSTYARCGIFINITPLEPGWKGFLTIEIYNANPIQTKVYANEGIAVLVFFEGEQPTQTYEGKYQNQENRVVFAR